MNKPSDCGAIEFIKYNDKKIGFISRMRYDQIAYGFSNQIGNPAYYTIKNDKLYFYPVSGSTDNVEITYFKYPTTITSLSQEVPKAFATMLSYYVAAHASWARGNDKRGDKFFALFTSQLNNAVEEYTGPLQLGDAESTEMTSIYGNDDNTLIF